MTESRKKTLENAANGKTPNTSKTVNILGTKYTVYLTQDLSDTHDGFCDYTVKKIFIFGPGDNENDPFALADWTVRQREVVRHEIIHAFMFESGLDTEIFHPCRGHDEQTIDWFAQQLPKIVKVCEELDVLW